MPDDASRKLPAAYVVGKVAQHLDPRVIHEIVEFHNSTNFVMGTSMTEGVGLPLIPQRLYDIIQYSEIQLTGDRARDIPLCGLVDEGQAELVRRRSTPEFRPHGTTSMAVLASLLLRSFARPHERAHYPSAGGLYPVEVFVAARASRIEPSLDTGIYHFLPLTCALEIVCAMGDADLKALVTGGGEQGPDPDFTLIYVLFIGRSAVKYRFKGYRFGLMEAGAMYQQADAVANALGLSNRVWAAFSEHQVLQELGLDAHAYLPLIVQHFGR